MRTYTNTHPGFARKRQYDTKAQSIYHRPAVKTNPPTGPVDPVTGLSTAKPIVFVHGIGTYSLITSFLYISCFHFFPSRLLSLFLFLLPFPSFLFTLFALSFSQPCHLFQFPIISLLISLSPTPNNLGIGFAHYMGLITAFPRDVDVYLVEWPHVAMQMSDRVRE